MEMGVRGLAPGKFMRLHSPQCRKTAFFVRLQGAITCVKCPFHEITTKFLANHAARRSPRSRIHESKISKSRNHEPKISQITLHVQIWGGGPFKDKEIALSETPFFQKNNELVSKDCKKIARTATAAFKGTQYPLHLF